MASKVLLTFAFSLLFASTLLAVHGAKEIPAVKLNHKHGLKVHSLMTEKQLGTMFAHSEPSTIKHAVSSKASTPFTPNGIVFHGGSTLNTGVNLYIIWYGTWSSSQKSTITTFLNSLDPSNPNVPNSVRNWWAVNGAYFDNNGKQLATTVSIKAQIVDAYSHGSNLQSNDITYIAYTPMANGKLPFDTNGIYLVLTSADVKVSHRPLSNELSAHCPITGC
jgi:hypothetical protein